MGQWSLKNWLICLFFVLLSFFMVNRLFFFSEGIAETTTSYILYPFLKIQNFFVDPVYTYMNKKREIKVLQEQIDQLQAENQDLQSQIISLQQTLDFQNSSEEVRQFAKKYDFSAQKITHILMRSFDDNGHFFWVDAGMQQGITLNMIAVYKNNIVGRVIDVDPLYSKIAVVTDKRCKIAVTCLQTQTVGIYEGHNNFEPTLEYVPHYQTLQQDDMIVSTGQGLVYPQGFAVGKIKELEVQDVAYKAIIEPLVDLHTIEYVYLVAT